MNLKPMKRLEIVIDSPHIPRLLEALRQAGAHGYTVLPGAEGYGERGEQHADEVSGVSANSYVLVAIPIELLAPITSAVRPLLQACGGICLVSDCQWLDH